MSNFATFSEFYERLAVFRSQMNENEFLKLAAFDAAMQSLKALCDCFAEGPADDASDYSPPYTLLTSTRSNFRTAFDIPALDAVIKEKVLPELERLIQAQQDILKVSVRHQVVTFYTSGITYDKEQELLTFLNNLYARGFSIPLLYPLLLSLKKEYFKPGRPFAAHAEFFEHVIKIYAPTRFEYGLYHFTPTDTQYYQYYRNLRASQSGPYSARDVTREITVAQEREGALQATPMSASAPSLGIKKLS